MKFTKTNRGFDLIKFSDLYKQKCTIQKSSLATQDALWVGVTKTGPNMGSTDVNNRMLLNRKQVAAMIPILQFFVENGELPSANPERK